MLNYPNSTCLIHIFCGESHLQRMRSYNVAARHATLVLQDLQSDLTLVDNMSSHSFYCTQCCYTEFCTTTHTHILPPPPPPPIRRNNLNVKQVPSWSGPHSPSFEKFGLWCFCQVAIVLSDTHGNKRTMCNLDLIITSVLHCYLHFLYQGGEEMLILDGSFYEW